MQIIYKVVDYVDNVEYYCFMVCWKEIIMIKYYFFYYCFIMFCLNNV